MEIFTILMVIAFLGMAVRKERKKPVVVVFRDIHTLDIITVKKTPPSIKYGELLAMDYGDYRVKVVNYCEEPMQYRIHVFLELVESYANYPQIQ